MVVGYMLKMVESCRWCGLVGRAWRGVLWRLPDGVDFCFISGLHLHLWKTLRTVFERVAGKYIRRYVPTDESRRIQRRREEWYSRSGKPSPR